MCVRCSEKRDLDFDFDFGAGGVLKASPVPANVPNKSSPNPVFPVAIYVCSTSSYPIVSSLCCVVLLLPPCCSPRSKFTFLILSSKSSVNVGGDGDLSVGGSRCCSLIVESNNDGEGEDGRIGFEGVVREIVDTLIPKSAEDKKSCRVSPAVRHVQNSTRKQSK